MSAVMRASARNASFKWTLSPRNGEEPVLIGSDPITTLDGNNEFDGELYRLHDKYTGLDPVDMKLEGLFSQDLEPSDCASDCPCSAKKALPWVSALRRICSETYQFVQSFNPSLSSSDQSFSADFSNFLDDSLPDYIQRGPKKKQVYIWQCCQCGQGRLPIRYEGCPSCGIARCAYCPVSKVRM